MLPSRVLRSATAACLALSLCAGEAVLAPARAEEAATTEPPAPMGQARVEGRVYSSDGKEPVRGAVVRLRYLDDGREVASPPTDSKGRFEIDGLEHGYLELVVGQDGSAYLGSDVISLPPKGRIAVDLALIPRDERSASWWAGRQPPAAATLDEVAGLAELHPEIQGRDFWKSKKGIAILAAVGGAALLGIALSARSSPSSGN